VQRRAAKNEIKGEGNMQEAGRGVRRENGGKDYMNGRKTKIKKFGITKCQEQHNMEGRANLVNK
jgi:hypothetical protein